MHHILSILQCWSLADWKEEEGGTQAQQEETQTREYRIYTSIGHDLGEIDIVW